MRSSPSTAEQAAVPRERLRVLVRIADMQLADDTLPAAQQRSARRSRSRLSSRSFVKKSTILEHEKVPAGSLGPFVGGALTAVALKNKKITATRREVVWLVMFIFGPPIVMGGLYGYAPFGDLEEGMTVKCVACMTFILSCETVGMGNYFYRIFYAKTRPSITRCLMVGLEFGLTGGASLVLLGLVWQTWPVPMGWLIAAVCGLTVNLVTVLVDAIGLEALAKKATWIKLAPLLGIMAQSTLFLLVFSIHRIVFAQLEDLPRVQAMFGALWPLLKIGCVCASFVHCTASMHIYMSV